MDKGSGLGSICQILINTTFCQYKYFNKYIFNIDIFKKFLLIFCQYQYSHKKQRYFIDISKMPIYRQWIFNISSKKHRKTISIFSRLSLGAVHLSRQPLTKGGGGVSQMLKIADVFFLECIGRVVKGV